MLLNIAVATLGSIFLFFILNWFGEKLTDYQNLTLSSADDLPQTFSFIYRIVAPNVVILIAGAILHLIDHTSLFFAVFLWVPGQFLTRLFFNFRRLAIFSWPRFFVTSILSTAIAAFILTHIFNDRSILLPDLKDLTGELWLGVIIYSYAVLNAALTPQSDVSASRTDFFLQKSYASFKTKYGQDIATKVPDLRVRRLIYSILILEDFNRPLGVRLIERAASLFKEEGTYGVMQVKSRHHLTDAESLNVGIDRIKQTFSDVLSVTSQENPQEMINEPDWAFRLILLRVVWFYNRDDAYANEVLNIYDKIELSEIPRLPTAVLDSKRLNAYFSSN